VAADLASSTVLFRWFLAHLGADRWEDLPLRDLQASEDAGIDAVRDVLLSADLHIQHQTLHALHARVQTTTGPLCSARRPPLRWRYFQYLALLAFQQVLERRASDREGLRASLAQFRADVMPGTPRWQMEASTGDDPLDRLALWQATGSGKTLMLHANLLQVADVRRRAGRPPHDHVLLLTPSEGLARQHVRELAASGLPGGLFDPHRRPKGGVIVVPITRLRLAPGPDTVHPDRFEGRNLVLVDEGHRGSSSGDGEWRRVRARLADGGMCIEYSATFAQAAAKDPVIHDELARSIVFAYPYRRFYADGYGKHWRILNVRADRGRALGDESLRSYLTAALVVLLQKLWLHRQNPTLMTQNNVARPLGVVVGASVVGRSEGRAEQSDLVRVLDVLARLVHPAERMTTVATLDALLAGELGFRSDSGDAFDPATVFPALVDAGFTGDAVYEELLSGLFGARAPGVLRLQFLGRAAGEVALSVGDAAPFGLVSVGDPGGLRRLCAALQPRVVLERDLLSGSLFDGLDGPQSTITLLLGSRRFAEGWSSWRVSMLGLLNLGRSAGTQIVQLFGRGVRLLGRGRSLRRSSNTTDSTPLRLLESLDVFGVRADYMEVFEAALREEGLPPVSPTAPSPGTGLTPAPTRPAVPLAPCTLGPSAQVNGVTVDLRAEVKAVSWSATGSAGPREEGTPGPLRMLELVDHDALYAALVAHRARRGWTALALPRQVTDEHGASVALTRALLRGRWYRANLPPWMTGATHRPLQQLPAWQHLGERLVCAYADAFVAGRRRHLTD
jgi:hypothetical protein